MDRKKTWRTAKKRKEDLDRLAFLEHINEKRGTGDQEKSHAGIALRKESAIPTARYGRFKHVADLMLALSIIALLSGAAAVSIEIVKIVQQSNTLLAGLERIFVWLLATTAVYGLLKGGGELLLLWADLAELNNSALEFLLREKDRSPENGKE